MITLSIVIPIYNEENRIEKSIRALKKGFNFMGVELKKVIFVDDGSDDKIKRILRRAQLNRKLKTSYQLISYKKNRGRGHAVKVGTQFSKTDYILYMDADCSIPLSNLKKFIPYMENNYDVISGSKKMPDSIAKIPRGFIRNIVGYGHSIIASALLGVFYWDFQGGFKIFSKRYVKEVFPMLQIDRWGFDMEVLFLAKKLGFKSKELPVTWSHIDRDSKVKLVRDINRSLKDIFIIQINWFTGKYHYQYRRSFLTRLDFHYL